MRIAVGVVAYVQYIRALWGTSMSIHWASKPDGMHMDRTYTYALPMHRTHTPHSHTALTITPIHRLYTVYALQGEELHAIDVNGRVYCGCGASFCMQVRGGGVGGLGVGVGVRVASFCMQLHAHVYTQYLRRNLPVHVHVYIHRLCMCL